MDQIQNYSVFENFMNIEYQIIRFLKISEYRIVIFGLNYSITEYLKANSSPQKILYVKFVTKRDLILYFHTYMRAFYCVFNTFLAYKKIQELFGIW